MIEDSARREFERVIVWRFDRFSRNRFDSANYKHILRKNGVEVVSATEVIPDGAEGILLEALLDGFSEYYSWLRDDLKVQKYTLYDFAKDLGDAFQNRTEKANYDLM